MYSYFFILGRNPNLSVAEILALLQRENIRHQITAQSSELLILKTSVDITGLFSELGGSIKFGEIIGEYAAGFDFASHLPSNDKKIFFGFSIYRLNDGVTEAAVKKFQNYLKGVAMEIKKAVSARSGRSRFVTGKSHELSSVIVKTNKLLTSGAEFTFFLPNQQFHGSNHGTAVLVGKTIAVQDFAEYERRDYGRPRRNIMRGMLPPKIAKMMINLSGAAKDWVLLDPFCGEGTVLAEAAVLGYENLFGFDVDENAVEDSRVNLDWIRKQYFGDAELRVESTPHRACYGAGPAAEVRHRKKSEYDIRRGDVRELASLLPENSVNAIVTEPYLGPLIRGQVEEKEVLKIKEELERLYAAAFKNFTKILKSGSRVVFIFPVWRTKQKNIFIDLDRILSADFKVQNLCDVSLRKEMIVGGDPTGHHQQGDNLPADCSPRGSIIWQRPDQKVLREILVLGLEK